MTVEKMPTPGGNANEEIKQDENREEEIEVTKQKKENEDQKLRRDISRELREKYNDLKDNPPPWLGWLALLAVVLACLSVIVMIVLFVIPEPVEKTRKQVCDEKLITCQQDLEFKTTQLSAARSEPRIIVETVEVEVTRIVDCPEVTCDLEDTGSSDRIPFSVEKVIDYGFECAELVIKDPKQFNLQTSSRCDSIWRDNESSRLFEDYDLMSVLIPNFEEITSVKWRVINIEIDDFNSLGRDTNYQLTIQNELEVVGRINCFRKIIEGKHILEFNTDASIVVENPGSAYERIEIWSVLIPEGQAPVGNYCHSVVTN